MENKDISQIALQKIKESGIKPISKNIFNFKKVLFWSFVGTSVVIGVISFSVILSILFNNDWVLYNKFGFNFIFKSMPYFWFICLLLFAILGEFYYRKTLLGYRHRMVTIVGIYIIFTIISGSILYIAGLGNIIDESLSKNLPIYNGVMFDKNEFWYHPEDGLLYGKIIGINENLIQIVDFNNNIWVLNIEDAFIGGKVKIEIGETIKIIGDIENDIFIVEQVRPCLNTRHGSLMCNMMR